MSIRFLSVLRSLDFNHLLANMTTADDFENDVTPATSSNPDISLKFEQS